MYEKMDVEHLEGLLQLNMSPLQAVLEQIATKMNELGETNSKQEDFIQAQNERILNLYNEIEDLKTTKASMWYLTDEMKLMENKVTSKMNAVEKGCVILKFSFVVRLTSLPSAQDLLNETTATIHKSEKLLQRQLLKKCDLTAFALQRAELATVKRLLHETFSEKEIVTRRDSKASTSLDTDIDSILEQRLVSFSDQSPEDRKFLEQNPYDIPAPWKRDLDEACEDAMAGQFRIITKDNPSGSSITKDIAEVKKDLQSLTQTITVLKQEVQNRILDTRFDGPRDAPQRAISGSSIKEEEEFLKLQDRVLILESMVKNDKRKLEDLKATWEAAPKFDPNQQLDIESSLAKVSGKLYILSNEVKEWSNKSSSMLSTSLLGSSNLLSSEMKTNKQQVNNNNNNKGPPSLLHENDNDCDYEVEDDAEDEAAYYLNSSDDEEDEIEVNKSQGEGESERDSENEDENEDENGNEAGEFVEIAGRGPSRSTSASSKSSKTKSSTDLSTGQVRSKSGIRQNSTEELGAKARAENISGTSPTGKKVRIKKSKSKKEKSSRLFEPTAASKRRASLAPQSNQDDMSTTEGRPSTAGLAPSDSGRGNGNEQTSSSVSSSASTAVAAAAEIEPSEQGAGDQQVLVVEKNKSAKANPVPTRRRRTGSQVVKTEVDDQLVEAILERLNQRLSLGLQNVQENMEVAIREGIMKYLPIVEERVRASNEGAKQFLQVLQKEQDAIVQKTQTLTSKIDTNDVMISTCVAKSESLESKSSNFAATIKIIKQAVEELNGQVGNTSSALAEKFEMIQERNKVVEHQHQEKLRYLKEATEKARTSEDVEARTLAALQKETQKELEEMMEKRLMDEAMKYSSYAASGAKHEDVQKLEQELHDVRESLHVTTREWEDQKVVYERRIEASEKTLEILMSAHAETQQDLLSNFQKDLERTQVETTLKSENLDEALYELKGMIDTKADKKVMRMLQQTITTVHQSLKVSLEERFNSMENTVTTQVTRMKNDADQISTRLRLLEEDKADLRYVEDVLIQKADIDILEIAASKVQVERLIQSLNTELGITLELKLGEEDAELNNRIELMQRDFYKVLKHKADKGEITSLKRSMRDSIAERSAVYPAGGKRSSFESHCLSCDSKIPDGRRSPDELDGINGNRPWSRPHSVFSYSSLAPKIMYELKPLAALDAQKRSRTSTSGYSTKMSVAYVERGFATQLIKQDVVSTMMSFPSKSMARQLSPITTGLGTSTLRSETLDSLLGTDGKSYKAKTKRELPMSVEEAREIINQEAKYGWKREYGKR
jgi:hypothetical protein